MVKVDGILRTTKQTTYTPRLCWRMAEGIAVTLSGMAKTGGGPTGHIREGVKCKWAASYSGQLDGSAFHFLNEKSSRQREAVLGRKGTGFYPYIDDSPIAIDGGHKKSGEAKVNKLAHQVSDALEARGGRLRREGMEGARPCGPHRGMRD